MRFRRFGIVGFGHFGEFMARSLRRHGPVLVSDVTPPDLGRGPWSRQRLRVGTIEEIAACDLVVVAVPFAALGGVLEELAPHLGPGSVVMEVVSTKVHSTALLERILADHPNVLATHPLFGPPSMRRMGRGQHLVVTHERGAGAAEALAFLHRRYGLQIHPMTPEVHDRAMAYMQALPFFVARALVDLDILDLEHREVLSLPSFEKLATIAAIEEHHTDAMFETSQRSNPFAAAARRQLIEVLGSLDAEIGAGHFDFHPAVHADPGTLPADGGGPNGGDSSGPPPGGLADRSAGGLGG